MNEIVTDSQSAGTQEDLSLSTWGRQRSGDELRRFIDNRHESVDISDLLLELGV